jgi:pilus assembly protein Flp/PilA
MSRLLLRLLSDQSGVTILEYGFTAVLIALVLVATLTTLGTTVGSILNNAATNL